jgi:hypothetical protein
MKINHTLTQFAKLVHPIFFILFVVSIAAALVGFESIDVKPLAANAAPQIIPNDYDAMQAGQFNVAEGEVQTYSNDWLHKSLNIDPFFLQVYIIDCTVSGKSIYAIVNSLSTAGYSYLWFADDVYAGNKSKVECLKASVVTLTVIRLSDGASVTKVMYFKPPNSFSTGG